MASRKSFLSKISSIFASPSTALDPKSVEGDLEFDEDDVWNSSNNNNNNMVTESKQRIRCGKKKGSKKVEGGGRVNPVASPSLPMDIPDWSNILKEDYEKHMKRDIVSDDDNHGGYDIDMEPPHEYLARTRGASPSVQEGKGRTLKGRDLRSFRNSIWKNLSFED